MSTKQEQEVVKEKDKIINEKDLHIQFLTERLEAWAERNWTLRTELLNLNVDKFVEKKQKMLEGFQKDSSSKEIL